MIKLGDGAWAGRGVRADCDTDVCACNVDFWFTVAVREDPCGCLILWYFFQASLQVLDSGVRAGAALDPRYGRGSRAAPFMDSS